MNDSDTRSISALFSNEISVDRDDDGVWKNRDWEMFQWSFNDEYVIFYWYEEDAGLLLEKHYGRF